MKIKLSVKDKNLVAMCWLAEIVLHSLVDCEKNSAHDIPPEKADMYKQISEMFVDAHDKVKALNDKFDEQIKRVFDEHFSDVLCDLTLSVVTLYEKMSPEQFLKIMREAGITEEDILETYKKST